VLQIVLKLDKNFIITVSLRAFSWRLEKRQQQNKKKTGPLIVLPDSVLEIR
jgi:hypothetical protein